MWLICALAKWGTDYQWWILVKSIQGRSLRGASLQDWCHGTDTANWPTQSSYLEPLYLYRFCWAGVCHGCLIRWFSQRKRKKLLVSSEVADSPPLFIASLLSGIWASRGELQIYQTGFLIIYIVLTFPQVFSEFRKSYLHWSHLRQRKYCKSFYFLSQIPLFIAKSTDYWLLHSETWPLSERIQINTNLYP